MPGEDDEPVQVRMRESSVSGSGSGSNPVRRFTWKELSQLNSRHNAHVAVRGKVSEVSRKK